MNNVLRLIRIACDMTIQEIADATGFSYSYISEIERGKKNPSNNCIEKYSEVSGIDSRTIKLFGELYSGDLNKSKFRALLIVILSSMKTRVIA